MWVGGTRRDLKGWLAGVGVLPRERPCNRTQEGEGGAETAVSETSKNLGELHGERGVNVLFFSHCKKSLFAQTL